MRTRKTSMFGLTVLGLVLAAPAMAEPNFIEGGYIVAQRQSDEMRPEPRDTRRGEAADADKRPSRDVRRNGPEGYGYGYERREQQRLEDADRARGRR